MNKQDYIQLIASLVVFYQIQHAVLTDLPIQPESVKKSFRKIWKRIRTRAYKAGVSHKCFFAIDCRAHAIAYNFYSDSFGEYIFQKHS